MSSILAHSFIRRLIALTVAAAAVALTIENANAADVYGPGEVTFREAVDANSKPLYVLTLVGTIVYPVSIELADFIKENFKDSRPAFLILNSPGGSLQEGQKIIASLRAERAKGRKFSTSVENGSMCASMCFPIYMQGDKRYAGEVASFMVHGAIKEYGSNIPDFFMTAQYLDTLTQAGVDKSWLDGLNKQGVFTKPGAYWISGKELFDLKVNVVTKTIPRWVQEEPQSIPLDPQIRSR